ncbi:MAG: hypothetical protein AAGI38_20895 [Bacteroidota bacterium]
MLSVPERNNQQQLPPFSNRMKNWGMLFSVWLCFAAVGCSPDGAANISGRNLQDSLYRMDTLAARVLLETHFEPANKAGVLDSTVLKDSLKNANSKITKPPSKSGYSQSIITNNSKRSTPRPKKDTLKPPSLPVSIPAIDLQEPDPQPEQEESPTTKDEAVGPKEVQSPIQAPKTDQKPSNDPPPKVTSDTIGNT